MIFLGVDRSLGIILALVMSLSLIAFGFRFYFRGRHFWFTYYVISLIGTMSVSLFFLMMYWVSIDETIKEKFLALFRYSMGFIILTVIFAGSYFFFEKYVKKRPFHQIYDIGSIINAVDSLIFVFDKMGLKVREFGNLRNIDFEGNVFNTIEDLYHWESQYHIKYLEKSKDNLYDAMLDEAKIMTYEGAFLMIKASTLRDRNNHQIGDIVMIRDVTEEQRLINELDEANINLEKANHAFYRSIDQEIRLKKEHQKSQMVAEANKVLLDGIGAVIESMDRVLDDPRSTLEECKKTICVSSDTIEKIYIGLRGIINRLSFNEEKEGL